MHLRLQFFQQSESFGFVQDRKGSPSFSLLFGQSIMRYCECTSLLFVFSSFFAVLFCSSSLILTHSHAAHILFLFSSIGLYPDPRYLFCTVRLFRSSRSSTSSLILFLFFRSSFSTFCFTSPASWTACPFFVAH